VLMTELVRTDFGVESERISRLADLFAGTMKSPNTRTAYRLDILGHSHPFDECEHRDPAASHRTLAWLPWCWRNNVYPLTARPAHVKLWLTDLAATGEAEGTRARRLSAVSSWYAYLVEEEQADRNPADLRAKSRPHWREPGTAGIALSLQQAEALLAAADSDGPRTAALIAVMLFAGPRVSEVTNLNTDSIKPDRGTPTLTLVGKGNRIRLAPLPPAVFGRVETYLATRQDIPGNLPAVAAGSRAPQPMFVTAAGKRLDRAYVFRLIRRLGRCIGLTADITPHDLRRTFASIARQEKVPLQDVQDAMGHKDPRTTQSYDRTRNDPDRHPSYALQRAFSGSDAAP
jgi:integrase/recombinase XerD